MPDFREELLPEFYFQSNPLRHFPELIRWGRPVWETLDGIRPALTGFFAGFDEQAALPSAFDLWVRPTPDGGSETVLFARTGYVFDRDICCPNLGFYFARNVIVEPTAIIKAPAYIGPGTEIRQGAYLRGDVITGSRCTIGHTTEMKSSIFLDHTEAGHLAYIEDSVIGSCVNLGAGTKLANLPFRTFEDKRDVRFADMVVSTPDGEFSTGRAKIGACLGDGVEVGCNATIAPAAFIGRDTWIYPCLSIPRGFYPARSILKHPGRPTILPKRD